ncbi:U7 snRNA-associated Sm-like protein LSm11 [Colossoma macropomum]|uniref:U7 snRNA-associated Sm-like protein LSm11 n=1 Tax=Colossoma macropomum TaxID=42526 RepID=UPI0018652E08|nr:U7 snRNA-associated Sm-like protein LSm11 [Colossoma macropomum]
MEESEREGGSESSSAVCGQSAALNASEQQVSEQDRGENTEADEDDIDKKLDISSELFDPLLALYSPQVPLPYPNIRCFNNVAEYESFIKGGRGRAKPENVEKKLRKSRRGVADPERIERLKKLMVNNPVEEGEETGAKQSRRKQKARKNVLTRMPLHDGSPLGELNRCVQERIRIKVHIRSFKGLRGVCTGFVVAFDKFWNLAMVDVDETYREPLLGEAFYHEKALTVTRLFQKLQVQEGQELSTGQKNSGKTAAANTSTPADQSSEPHYTTRSSIRSSRGQRQPLCGKGPADSGPDAGSEQRPKVPKPKVEYGRMRTRHVNQLFIRGENVLLVNVQQE